MPTNFVSKAFIMIQVMLMLSSLYYIDLALGRGFALIFVRLLSNFKYIITETIMTLPPIKDVLHFPNGSKAVSVFAAEIILFAIVMILVSRAKDRSEKKIDEFLTQTKARLRETYASIEKQKNALKFEASINQSASGDCVCAQIPMSRCFCPILVDYDDVTRVTGYDEVDSETSASCTVYEDDVIDDYIFNENCFS